MTKGDRYFILSCVCLIVAIMHAMDDDYVFWFFYLIGVVIFKILEYRSDNRERK
jgi:hypothetical protein